MKLKIKEKNFLYLAITAEFILSMILYAIMYPILVVGCQTLIDKNEAYEFGVALYLLIIGEVLYAIVAVFLISLLVFFVRVYQDYMESKDDL